MSRAFPLALVQAEPLDVDAPIAGVRLPGPGGVLSDLPQTHLAVYPELHLYGGGSLPDGMHRKWAPPCRSPGSRAAALAELVGDLGVWLLPGTLCERGDDRACTTPPSCSPGLDNCSDGPRPSDRPSLTSIEVQ